MNPLKQIFATVYDIEWYSRSRINVIYWKAKLWHSAVLSHTTWRQVFYSIHLYNESEDDQVTHVVRRAIEDRLQ